MPTDTDQVENEIRALSHRVIDLGLFIEEHYKNAITLLFNRDWDSGYFPITPDISPIALNGQLMQLIQMRPLQGEFLRTVLVLQKACSDFEYLLDLINRIAGRARSLDRDVEFYLQDLRREDHDAFFAVLNSAHVQLRGCIIALNTRQSDITANVIQQDNYLDMAYLRAKNALQRLIDLDVSRALPMAHLLLILGDIEQLGNYITRICQGIELILNGHPPEIAQGYAAAV